MGQIFVSHSARDSELVSFFAKCASGTRVKLVFEEFESIIAGRISGERIRADIKTSSAVFVLLSSHVAQIPHTRDWVVWECGVAHNKDTWVFEPSETELLSVITPILRHYVLFSMNRAWFAYVRKIIESYDDSAILPSIAAGAAAGALAGGVGAVLGGVAAALAASPVRRRPPGLPVNCPSCRSSYQLHYPEGLRFFRCPVCNMRLRF